MEVDADATGWSLSSTSSFTDVNVNTGLFENNGSLTVTNLLTVDSGATFGGTGTTIGNVTNNGTVSPGSSSVGTQIITGNFTQNSGGTLEIEFNSSGIDLLDISGTASLAGTLQLTELTTGIDTDTAYTFLEADGGISGSFTTTTTTFLSSSTISNATVSIGSTAATVTFSAGTGLEDVAEYQNGQDVSDGLDGASSSDAAAVVEIANAINASSSPSDALSSQSGMITEAATNSANLAMKNVANIIEERLAPKATSRSIDGSWSSWAQGVGGFATVDSDSNSQGAEYDLYGTVIGAELDLKDNKSKVGVFVGYVNAESDIIGINDSSEVDSYQVGIYASTLINEDLSLNGSLSGTYLDFKTTRSTSEGTAAADFSGLGALAQANLIYDVIKKDSFIISPYLGVEGSVVNHEDHDETGADVLNMRLDEETMHKLSSVIGVRYRGNYQNQGFVIQPAVKFGWSHEYLDNSIEQGSRFVSATSATIDSEGPIQNRDSAIIGLDLTIENTQNTANLYVSYDAEISSDYDSHLFAIGLKWQW